MLEASMNTLESAAARIAGGLRKLVGTIVPGAAVEGLQRLSGGATQETWRFEAVSPAGNTTMILRRAPNGDHQSQEAVGLDIEARLIAAARARDVPVPLVKHVLTPADGLGSGFIMDFVEGETLGKRIVKSETYAVARQTLSRRCGEILAKVHSIDPAQFPSLRSSAPSELLQHWEDQYRSTHWPRPVFICALRWLRQTCPPPPARPCVVHGDFRNGNLIIGADGIRAVLDWELAHIGDPMEDIGWLCVNSWRFGRMDKVVGGFGDLADLIAGYNQAAGASIRIESCKWWEVFGTLRWGVMCATMTRAFRSSDPSVERAAIARRASETEIDLLRLLAG
jgi:aminoglycoside phosphotransferase (APT) family kinase protein